MDFTPAFFFYRQMCLKCHRRQHYQRQQMHFHEVGIYVCLIMCTRCTVEIHRLWCSDAEKKLTSSSCIWYTCKILSGIICQNVPDLPRPLYDLTHWIDATVKSWYAACNGQESLQIKHARLHEMGEKRGEVQMVQHPDIFLRDTLLVKKLYCQGILQNNGYVRGTEHNDFGKRWFKSLQIHKSHILPCELPQRLSEWLCTMWTHP